MTSLAVAFPGDTLIVQPWPDTVVDHTGHDPRSPYVEQFWLAVLGPSTTWLLRYFAALFDRWPDGFEINLDDTARAIGLVNQTGRGSPFARALSRSVQFNLAQPFGFGLAVRRRVPPLSARQIQHLPAPLQSAHEAWAATPSDDEAAKRRRARRLARALLELGEDPPSIEWQLRQWRFHPGVCADAVRWARQERAGIGAA
jgi:hypothetical protein